MKRTALVTSMGLALALSVAGGAVGGVPIKVYPLDSIPGDRPERPTGILAQGRDGHLYGTTWYGGLDRKGTAFRFTRAGTITKLHDFRIGIAHWPFGGLVLGTDGGFYGVTLYGSFAERDYRPGTVFRMTRTGDVLILGEFSAGKGGYPHAPPLLGRDGLFYGTADRDNALHGGIFYRLSPGHNPAVLYDFDLADPESGAVPGGLLLGKEGNFYGVTNEGGKYGDGTLFRMTPNGAFKVLRHFNEVRGGHGPSDPPVQDAAGNLYGTTSFGGSDSLSRGVIYKRTSKGAWKILHQFTYTDHDTEGSFPNNLVLASDGNLYGTTSDSGPNKCGTLFRIKPTGSGFEVLHAFGDSKMGCRVETLMQHTDGKVHGTTVYTGGIFENSDSGTVFRADVGGPPFVALVPNFGKVGTTIGLLGNFQGLTRVEFNGVSATFSGRSRTYRTAVVPAGAATGLITVTTDQGTVSSKDVFYALPTLKRVSPREGAVGASVVLTGTSLTQTNKVIFNRNKPAVFTVKRDGRVVATVPTGATTGKIKLVTEGGTVTSARPFTVLP